MSDMYLVSTRRRAFASGAVHREVTTLREAGNSVVVSMRNFAASGGYLRSGQSPQAICLSVPDHLLHGRPACVARLAAHAWLRLCKQLQFSPFVS